jgi:hypothetical protein
VIPPPTLPHQGGGKKRKVFKKAEKITKDNEKHKKLDV